MSAWRHARSTTVRLAVAVSLSFLLGFALLGGSVYAAVSALLLRDAREAMRGDKAIELQPREFRLLEYLMRQAGRVVTRTMLLEAVWDYHFDPQTNVIDVHISRLRQKIDHGFATPLLHTVRGAGYRLGS